MEDQKLDDGMAPEENFIDPGEEDDDYDPDDEDSIDSEEEATSADEEYTPTRGTTPIPARTTPTTTTIRQVPRQGGEFSEYEKIREENIREKEQMLRSLQGDWQAFKRSEGLAAGGSQR